MEPVPKKDQIVFFENGGVFYTENALDSFRKFIRSTLTKI